MPFDWSEFISLAQQLRSQSDEASHRSAISRAYYGVFCQARNYLEGQDATSEYRNGDVHSKVWRAYMNQGRQAHTAIGKAGMRLRDLRNTADYYDEINKLEEKLTLSFLEIDRIVQYMSQIRKDN